MSSPSCASQESVSENVPSDGVGKPTVVTASGVDDPITKGSKKCQLSSNF